MQCFKSSMPKFNPPPHEQFNFERPSEWPEWKQRFSRYRLASKRHKNDEDAQISSLVYAMDRESEHVFKSFRYAEEGDDKKYSKVLGKFAQYTYIYIYSQHILSHSITGKCHISQLSNVKKVRNMEQPAYG